eukprot:260694-Chlamydomonas_euryale.AAC.2
MEPCMQPCMEPCMGCNTHACAGSYHPDHNYVCMLACCLAAKPPAHRGRAASSGSGSGDGDGDGTGPSRTGGMQLAHDAFGLQGELAGLSSRSHARTAMLAALAERQLSAARLMAEIGLTGVEDAAGGGTGDGADGTAGPLQRTSSTRPASARCAAASFAAPGRGAPQQPAHGSGEPPSMLAAALVSRPAWLGSARASQRARGAALAHAAAAAAAANGSGGRRMSSVWSAAAAAAAAEIEDRRNGERMFGRLVQWTTGFSEASSGRSSSLRGGAGDLAALPTAQELVSAADALLVATTVDAPAAGGADSEPCCICLEPMAADDAVRALRCGHRMHGPCLRRWLLGKAECVCPFCRQTSAEEGSVGGAMQ